MNAWNHIINTALLGTDKKQVTAAELPDGLSEIAGLVAARPGVDKEEQFLQVAAAAFNYRQSGSLPLQQEVAALPVCADESLPYCAAPALQALNDILAEENNSLLLSWLQQCHAARQLVRPDLIPVLLNIAAQHKALRELVAGVCGKRGEWLSRLNPHWHFMPDMSGDDLWQTGTAEQRRALLKQLRQEDPAKARELLQESWMQENANSKADLLKQLSGTVSTDDKEWLESLLAEKSVKVKDEVLTLLKQLPESSVIGQYWQLLQQAVVLKKEKALLGMVSKTSLHIALPATVDDAIYKTGIDKLSNNTSFSDEAYIIHQLMRYIPPSWWETHFAAGPEAIIGYFQKDKEHKKYIGALVNAVLQSGDRRWAIALMQHSEVFYIDIIPLLPAEQQEFYSVRYMEKHPDSIIQYARQRQHGWSPELASAILRHTAKNPYHYNRSFYAENIHRIPAGVIAVLDHLGPPESHLRAMWDSMREYIARLSLLQQQTINAFKQ